MSRRWWTIRKLPVLLCVAGAFVAGSGTCFAVGGGHGGGGGHAGGGGRPGAIRGGAWHGGYGPGFRGYYGGYYGYPYGYGYGLGFGYGYVGYGGYPYAYGGNYPNYGYAPADAYYVDPYAYPPPAGPGSPPPSGPGMGSPASDYPVQGDRMPGSPGPADAEPLSRTSASTLVGVVTPPSPPRALESDVMIIVRVPSDALVWINGMKTTQSGTRREFVSAGPDPGRTYTFQVRTQWMAPNGRPVNFFRRVPVQAGERRVVDFTMPPSPNEVPPAPSLPSR